jgi:transketolase
MINPNAKLNPKMFDKGVLEAPIRRGFGEGLVVAGERDENVVGLCADLTESAQMLPFKQKFPGRYIEVGVAEQNLAGVASGMAAMGKIPFIASYAMFSPGRNWEHIRTTICYNNQPVKIVGSHAGVSVGPDGGTHQAIEDIALTRVLPRMVVISPCDAIEAKKATIAAAKTNTPVYIRLAREKTPIMTTEDAGAGSASGTKDGADRGTNHGNGQISGTPFEIGKAAVFFQPIAGKADVGIIATGALLYKALKVANDLEKEKIGVTVINLSTIKPLDERAIVRLAQEAGAIVTVEEHQIAGGMGSAVAECLAKFAPVPIEFIGVKDQFGQSGTPEELIEHYGMGESHIRAAVKKVLARKRR